MPSLVVVAPGGLCVRDGRFWADAKLLSGMQMYAECFPGDVSLVGLPAQSPDAVNLGVTSVAVADLGYDITATYDIRSELARRHADVSLLPLTSDIGQLLNVSRKDVVAAEHTGLSRLSMALATPHSLKARVRMEVGFRRLGRRLVDVVRAADGVQCNGAVAWNAYASLSPMPVRVYDNRVTPDVIEIATKLRSPYRGGRLRLGFSGRLMAIKGPEYAVALPRVLEAHGVEATLDVFGDGPDRATLERVRDERVRFRGSVPFPDQWTRQVSEGVDLMVLPHVQPDPSGTYLECAGVGVPVLGFDNAQLSSLVSEAGLGWVVPMCNTGALAARALQLSKAPEQVERASAAALTFMRRHHFALDFERRVQHLVEVLLRR